MNWITTNNNIPIEPNMSFGWSNHILVYSKSEDCWFEAVYCFLDNQYYTLEHKPLKQYEISHFCENIDTPQ